MSGHGIARVISLLSESEVGTYVQPPTDTLATLFKRAVLVDAKVSRRLQPPRLQSRGEGWLD